MSQEYQVTQFRPEHLPGVLDVLGGLWKFDLDTRGKLFHWKYLENPSCTQPLGVVALHGDRVAGFRGYFANRYYVAPGGSDFVLLHPCDTCVDPGHRNRNLSVAMGNFAKEQYAADYRLFMNTTCSKNSLPGYLKMGFLPLASKVQWTRHGANPINWVRGRQAQAPRPLAESRIRSGRFGEIQVTTSPMPEQMALLAESAGSAALQIRPRQDRRFFEWRYRNPVRKYVFYFLMSGDSVRGYVVVGVSPNNLQGEILDYGPSGGGVVPAILRYIIRSRAFVQLSVYRYGADEELVTALQQLGFSADPPWRRITGRRTGEANALPLLLRPIPESYGERDLVVEGLDVRQLENWGLKPICSDAA
jgi:hypothetical protein